MAANAGGRPAPHPVRVAPAPVSGRQQAAVPSQSGSSTPGTTASTSGRAGSTGRVQVASRSSLEARQWHRPVVFPSGKAVVSPGSPTLPRQELNAPSSWQSPVAAGSVPHQPQGREDSLIQPVRRARSAGRSTGPSADANKASMARRDSPVRASSPHDPGSKPRRASPQRKKGVGREASRSPEPPRARPPAASAQVSAPAEKTGSAGSPPAATSMDSGQAAPSFVKSLARLALVLESSGHSGTGAAAAAAAVAAAVAKQSDCEWIGDFQDYLQEGLDRRPLEQAMTTGEDALRARCARLEHEVMELRCWLFSQDTPRGGQQSAVKALYMELPGERSLHGG
ncbi:unnamed protein product [Symbiodinium pilosum]|uniref:Uncharacterized protein n=1 Tax=Symbiodinium pilosum TaxID=2952 RepID=A0A812T982_SYMPI|nr:unnamed protein product [Symbiodinium pilosum]